MCGAKRHVRFTPESDIKCDITCNRGSKSRSPQGRNRKAEHVGFTPNIGHHKVMSRSIRSFAIEARTHSTAPNAMAAPSAPRDDELETFSVPRERQNIFRPSRLEKLRCKNKCPLRANSGHCHAIRVASLRVCL